MRKKQEKYRGFTVVEVVIALMVMSIVLAATATMADAMSSGKIAVEQIHRSNIGLMQIQNRMSDLILRASGISGTPTSTSVTLWYDTDDDGVVDSGTDNLITLYTDGGSRIYVNDSSEYYACTDVVFSTDSAIAEAAKQITVQFKISSSDDLYTISATMRARNPVKRYKAVFENEIASVLQTELTDILTPIANGQSIVAASGSASVTVWKDIDGDGIWLGDFVEQTRIYTSATTYININVSSLGLFKTYTGCTGVSITRSGTVITMTYDMTRYGVNANYTITATVAQPVTTYAATIAFDLIENGETQTYSVGGTLGAV